MSRVDHIVARRMEGRRVPRPVYDNAGPGRRTVRMRFDPATRKDVVVTTRNRHIQGDQWWRRHLADLVERRNDDGTYTPRLRRTKVSKPTPRAPEMLPRPDGMTRQVQRALYRKACKMAGVAWKAR